MFEKFYPDDQISSVYRVDYAALHRAGYRGVLYDIDNTLVLHDAEADERAKALFQSLRELGFKTGVVSNNHRPRVERFAQAVGVDLFLYDSHKPSAKAYLEAGEKLGIEREQLVFFGDQLFTDVLGAKYAGIRCVMVQPIGKEKLLRIKLKRYLEKPILWEASRWKGKEAAEGIPMIPEKGEL